MKVGVPKETAINERRVALVPETVGRLVKAGLEVLVERGAGEGAFCADELYRAAGATLVPEAGRVLAEADVVVKVQRPPAQEVALVRAGAAAPGGRRSPRRAGSAGSCPRSTCGRP